MQEEGTSFSDQADRLQEASGRNDPPPHRRCLGEPVELTDAAASGRPLSFRPRSALPRMARS